MQEEQANGEDQNQDEAYRGLAADVAMCEGKRARILPAGKISREAMRDFHRGHIEASPRFQRINNWQECQQ